MEHITIEREIEILKSDFENKISKLKKLHHDNLIAIDPICEFLLDHQIERPYIIDKFNNKDYSLKAEKQKDTKADKTNKPEIKILYEQFEYIDIITRKEADTQNTTEIKYIEQGHDIFYSVWIEHVYHFWKEKNELYDLYTGSLLNIIDSNDQHNSLYKILEWVNKLITKIKRRVVIIKFCIKDYVSIVQLQPKENGPKYNSIRGYWIDDYGRINRSINIPVKFITVTKLNAKSPKEKDYEITEYIKEDAVDAFIDATKKIGIRISMVSGNNDYEYSYMKDNIKVIFHPNEIDIYSILKVMELESQLRKFQE